MFFNFPNYRGISQLLHIGEIFHQVYAHPLGLLHKPQSTSSKSTINSTPHAYLNSDEVVVYTTRYRRTFQSAMALLYTFLPTEKWISLNIRESHSMSFCFSDCACPEVDELRKRSSKFVKTQLSQHSVVSAVVQWLGQLLLHHTSNGMTSAYDVRDAVLALLCHDAPLPCKKSKSKDAKSPITISPPTTLDLSDVINTDQEDTAGNVIQGSDTMDREEGESQSEGCIENSHISALMSFTNWLSGKEARQKYYKRTGLLRAYGLIRHIVGYMLKMISGDRTKFVLYSGHDWTMQFLTAAFGIHTETTFIPYASRMAFEVYKSESHTEYYFRVIYNGRDVTQQIDFCEGGKSLRVSRDSRGNKADLCPIENIIRFIHDDYFGPLNATNFKDACTIQSFSEF